MEILLGWGMLLLVLAVLGLVIRVAGPAPEAGPREAGDIVLVRSDPRDVPRIVTLSRASYRKMVQNLWWAAGYNIVAINAPLLRRTRLEGA